MTIGIQGDWGIGKTSLLNMIRENLSEVKRRNIPVCKIETWQYAQFSSEEQLSISVISAINKAIISKISNAEERRELHEKYKNLVSKIGKAASLITGNILKDKLGIDVKEISEVLAEPEKDASEDFISDVERYKQEFRTLVEKVAPNEEDRVVIMLDDLDRLKPIRALELLEAIKNFLDVEKTVFVLAIDYSVVRKGVREKLGGDAKEFYGKSFFDKIIQVPFNMPVTAYDIEAYIMALMGWKRDSKGNAYIRSEHYSENAFLAGTKRQYIDAEEAETFRQILSLTTGNNPRSIKRILNYANLLRMIYRENRQGSQGKGSTTWSVFEAQLILAMAAMHLAWPEVFNFFAQNPSPSLLEHLKDPAYLQDLPELQPLFQRVPDPAKTKAQISGLLDIIIGLLDADSSGSISSKEFEPLWDVLVYSNLANIELEDLSQSLRSFGALAKQRSKGNNWWTEEKIDRFISGFLKSNWNNPLYLRVLESSKYVRLLEWGKASLGSLVTKKARPIDFYLASGFKDLDPDSFFESAPEPLKDYIEAFDQPHLGFGNVRVKTEQLVESNPEQIAAVLNELLQYILATPKQ